MTLGSSTVSSSSSGRVPATTNVKVVESAVDTSPIFFARGSLVDLAITGMVVVLSVTAL